MPLSVFTIHEVLAFVFDAYKTWPHIDIPFHFAGGFAIAFFVSGCFQSLPREVASRSRTAVLELLLVGSITTTVAVFWEFAEFAIDQTFGTNIQASLANTMQDLALGVAGAGVYIAFRAWKLRAGKAEITEVALDWIH